ncbi:MAG: leucine-rich repeat protein [Clostridia bacterium]|nr:leucine-rich repeat protein [Clostridia bacterium]MBQ6383740.1 leucine-rich repeat protein [Clostridia bacterium]
MSIWSACYEKRSWLRHVCFFLFLCVFYDPGSGSAENVLKLPEETVIIEEEAFRNTTSVETVIIPKNVKYIGPKAFAGSSLKRAYFSSALTEIAEDAFEEDTSLIGYGSAEPGFTSYITPEEFGAKGDGITDDSAAFQKCLNSRETNVLLSGTYLIRSYITTKISKVFFAYPVNAGPGASIICDPDYSDHVLSFEGGVSFENIAFRSTKQGTGRSPHGEIYTRTSNIIFVEIWNQYGSFTNCYFTNALTGIRGRKSSRSTVIPQSITVRGCTFEECKSPVQGYCEKTTVDYCRFKNDGDLYSGDHCIYMERYGCKYLRVSNCTVETMNSASGAAFQIYGTPKAGDIIPELTVSGCTINANLVVSASAAEVTIRGCSFNEQRRDQYIARVEAGSMTLIDSVFNHSYAFSYWNTEVLPQAYNCTFTLMLNLCQTRCSFPLVSEGCTYVDWGGNVKLSGTTFTDCIFTRSGNHTLERLYINNSGGFTMTLTNTLFRSGDTIINNKKGITEGSNYDTF